MNRHSVADRQVVTERKLDLVENSDVAPQIQPRQRFAGDDVSVERGIVELLCQLLDEAGIHFFPRRTDRKPAEGHVAATLAERFRPVKLAIATILVALFEMPLCAQPTAARDPQEP